ncbi:hypothetical protein QCA50_012674 [Cerrena zonata]|uniref:Uncharacterized protein n=1 Tax=Cerrena zonata TaxID=2478898 RepID=A0AAW0FZR3_9APHY
MGVPTPNSISGSLNDHISTIFIFETPGGRGMENILTNDEIEVICGMYVDATDIRNQTALRSWWPLPTVWNVCGLNTNYWTRECEAWFQKHLAKVLAGGVQPLKSGEWHTSLRWHKSKTGKFLHTFETEY